MEKVHPGCGWGAGLNKERKTMNKHQRNQNRANAEVLRRKVRRAQLMQLTCPNCGENGGHWVSTQGLSLAALMTGQDDQEGFWTCPKLYGPDGLRLDGV